MAYIAGKWCARKWPVEWKERKMLHNMRPLEFFHIMVAVKLWDKWVVAVCCSIQKRVVRMDRVFDAKVRRKVSKGAVNVVWEDRVGRGKKR